MKKKAWLTIGISLVVIILCLGFFFTHQQKQNSATKSQQEQTTSTTGKTKMANKGSRKTSGFSDDEWMLMGYMAYARKNYEESRHIKSTSGLIDAVQQDLDNDNLNCKKSSNNTYYLSNGFGSVNIKVESDSVKVTGDGTTINNKSSLASKFAKFKDQINDLRSSLIKNEHSNQSGKSAEQNNSLNNEELVVATFLDNSGKASINSKINSTLKLLAKGTKADIDDYLSGFYINKGHLGISFNASTSDYADFYISGDEIKEITRNRGQLLSTSVSNKETIMKKYQPYKAQVDQIIAGLKENKQHASDYFKR